MGYTTEFYGSFIPNRDFTQEETDTINNLNNIRHEDGYEKGLSTWCHWIIEDGEVCWDGGEKFYNYIQWLEYLIGKYFEKWGIKLNGEVEFQGEYHEDRCLIVVVDNIVSVYGVTYDRSQNLNI